MKKVLKTFLIILLVFLIFCTTIMFIIGNYMYEYTISTSIDKTELLSNVSNRGNEEYPTEQEIYSNWIQDNSEEIDIIANDGVNLHGYEIKNIDSNVWCIIVHGYGSNALEMGEYSQRFFKMNCNVLNIDLRGCGKSESNYIGMGWQDRLDVVSWVEYINKKYEKSEIILFGVSMGAATIMLATGEMLPQNVKCAIEDCGYSSVEDEFSYQLKKMFKLSTFPLLNIASLVTKVKAGYFFEDVSVTNQLKNSKTPTLFIHGSEDTFVPYYMLELNYNIAGCEKEKLTIDGAEHIQSSKVKPEVYWSKVKEFSNKYLDEKLK